MAVGTALLLLGIALPAHAHALDMQLEATGRLDARFEGLDILAVIRGEIIFSGTVQSGGSTIGFLATGSAYGIAVRHILSCVSRGWIQFDATGTTADGAPIAVRCLVYAARTILIPLQAGEPVDGFHYTVVDLGERTDAYRGEVRGGLVGGLAPAEMAGTIRLQGSASFQFYGDPARAADADALPPEISVDDPDVPAEFRHAVCLLFGWEDASAGEMPGDMP